MTMFGASDKIVQYMQYQSAVNSTGGKKLLDNECMSSNIEVKDVQFKYPSKAEVQVLKGVSITVDNEKNRVVALVG